jgi:uncharacterized repeat protein (TIGR01451 family)
MAYADGDVRVTLQAARVTTANSHEVLASADQAKPGEILEYRAIYTNDGKSAVRQMLATLPIPAGVEYLPRTAAPAVVLASLDGKSFDAVPLMRSERTADGREVIREIPASEYRFLRWTVGTLAAKQSRTVTARVRVAPIAVAANAR